jgi:hypothetical protein
LLPFFLRSSFEEVTNFLLRAQVAFEPSVPRLMALVLLKKNTLLSQLESLRQENVGLERALTTCGARSVTLKRELDCLRSAVRVGDVWAHYDELTELRERLRLYSDVLVKLERSVR